MNTSCVPLRPRITYFVQGKPAVRARPLGEQYARYPELREHLGESDDDDGEWWSATTWIPETLRLELELLLNVRTFEVSEIEITKFL